ncbi:MAG: hypothetical protein Tsb0014_12840 [Pleurocapsa sp.]
MKLLIPNLIGGFIITLAILSISPERGLTQIVDLTTKADNKAEIIKGQSGGLVDSKGCGFISETPSHTMNLPQRVDYMRLTVESSGGEPTLLVLGPKSGDRFCVLGDRASGLKPEISGVWEAGEYKIYIGDRVGGKNYPFTLDISTDN